MNFHFPAFIRLVLLTLKPFVLLANIRRHLLITLSICTLMAGCSSSSQQPELPPESLQKVKQQASSGQTSVEALIAQYETKLKTFDPQLLAFYSPANFQAAQANFSEAMEAAGKAASPEAEVKLTLQTALAFLDRAQFTKKAVELHLKSANQHYLELLKLNAPGLATEPFKQVKTTFSTLIRAVENETTQDAIGEQADLIEAMIQVEIETLKHIHLQEAETYLQKSTQHNAKKYAADLYENAATKMAQTHVFIEKSFRDRSAIKKQSLETLDAARRCYFISKEAQKIDQLNDAELGQLVANNFKLIETLFLTTGKDAFIADDYPALTEELLSHIRRYEESAGQLKIDYETLLATQTAPKMKDQAEQSISENRISKGNISGSPGFAPGAVLSKPAPFPSKPASDFAEAEDSFDSIEFMKK